MKNKTYKQLLKYTAPGVMVVVRVVLVAEAVVVVVVGEAVVIAE